MAAEFAPHERQLGCDGLSLKLCPISLFFFFGCPALLRLSPLLAPTHTNSSKLPLASGWFFLFRFLFLEWTRRHCALGNIADGLHCAAEALECFRAFDQLRVCLH